MLVAGWKDPLPARPPRMSDADPAIWDGMKPSVARNAQLKACGNGVVPQQSAEATRRFLAWAATQEAAA